VPFFLNETQELLVLSDASNVEIENCVFEMLCKMFFNCKLGVKWHGCWYYSMNVIYVDKSKRFSTVLDSALLQM